MKKKYENLINDLKTKPTQTVTTKPLESSEANQPKIVFYVEKCGMSLYKLIKMEVDGAAVVSYKEVAKDLPNIIVGKLLREIQNQGFTGGK